MNPSKALSFPPSLFLCLLCPQLPCCSVRSTAPASHPRCQTGNSFLCSALKSNRPLPPALLPLSPGMLAIKVPSKFDLRRFCRATGGGPLPLLCRMPWPAVPGSGPPVPAVLQPMGVLHAHLHSLTLLMANMQAPPHWASPLLRTQTHPQTLLHAHSLSCRRHCAGQAGHPLRRRAGPGQAPLPHRNWRHQVHRAAAGGLHRALQGGGGGVGGGSRGGPRWRHGGVG